MSLSIAAGTAIAGAVSAAGSTASSAMGNAKNMRMYRKQVEENKRIRAEDYDRFLENRNYNSAASQMKRLTDAGMSQGGAASSVLGSNASSSMSSNAPSGSPGSGASSPDMRAPDYSSLGSVYQNMANIGNTNADTLLKQQQANKTSLEALGTEYDNALKANNATLAAQTLNSLIRARDLDNLLTEQQIYKTHVESGLIKGQSFNEWRKQYNLAADRRVQQELAAAASTQAAASTKNAETNRLDFNARSPYYSRTGLSNTVNALGAAPDSLPNWLQKLLGVPEGSSHGNESNPSVKPRDTQRQDAIDNEVERLMNKGYSYADAFDQAWKIFGSDD